jgi:xylan 1,4-beta-xylosidase
MAKRHSLKSTLLLLLLLPFLLLALKRIIDIRKGAAGVPAFIVIDTRGSQGPVNTAFWQNFSQGGEEPRDMVGPVSSQVRSLRPQLIRVDHIFDYYNVFQSPGSYNFNELDTVINGILQTGAKPMLSLSYTTPQMAQNGQNAGEPKNWADWYDLVRATAKRYSIDKNISGIYYEIWNEPDLFGSWHYAKNPNYSTLYVQSARAVTEGAGNTFFKVGGPSTTALYSNWLKSIFTTAQNNNVRLDFISWHKYSKNIGEFEKDYLKLNELLTSYPRFSRIEKIITESGPNSEPDAIYDNHYSAVHLISLVTKMYGKISRLFTFELVDGPSSRSDLSTGWGILTHPSKGGQPKPRYQALQFLNQLQGQKLYHSGDGTNVSSLSVQNGSVTQTILVNFDPQGVHTETVPVNYRHLSSGKYRLTVNTFSGPSRTKNVTVTTDTLSEILFLEPNTAVLLELSPIY